MAAKSESQVGRSRKRRRGEGGRSPLFVGVLAVVIIAIGSYLGFTKHIPFTSGYKLKAVFTSAVSIRKASPVRIAGVNVGKVSTVTGKPGSTDSVVVMELQDKGLPIHSDATMQIRPRIFLEGNFFVDLHPGTPEAPKLPDGGTIPVTQTSDPVQLDQVLTALQTDSRQDLQNTLKGLGNALDTKPTAAESSTLDAQVRHLTGAQAINRTFKPAQRAAKYGSQVNEALLGTSPHDLSKLIAGLGKVTAALNSREGQLQDLITNFNITMAATASQATALKASIRLLGPTLQSADRTLTDLNPSLPPTRAFAREALPGVRETGPTINAAFPFIEQTRALVAPSELQGLVRDLRPATADLARLTDRTIQLLPQVDLIDRCVKNVILPAGDVKLIDPPQMPRPVVENYKEFWYGLTGIAGEGQNFDGNATYVRFQVGGGTQTLGLGTNSLTGQTDIANTLLSNQQLTTQNRPIFPGHRPPYEPYVPCYTQKIPDYNGPAANNGTGVAASASASAAPAAKSAGGKSAAKAASTTSSGRHANPPARPTTTAPAPAPARPKVSTAQPLAELLDTLSGVKLP